MLPKSSNALHPELQMSDWERRPLSSKQTEYAALDAFVLLELYSAITDPMQGLTQQQLEPHIYNYNGQKLPPPASLASDMAKQLPADGQQHKRHAMQQDAVILSQRCCAPDIGDPAGACSSGALGTADQHTPKLQPLHTTASDVDRAASAPAPAQLSAQPKSAMTATDLGGQAVMLPAGSPLQQCLQENGLQEAVKSIAPGAG